MIGLLQAEFSRISRNRATYIMLLIAVGMTALTVVGAATPMFEVIEAGQLTVAAASRSLVGVAFVGGLFSAIYGILLVTPDIRHKVMPRLLQIEPGIWPVVLAKAVVAAVIGALIAVMGTGVAWGVGALLLNSKGYAFVIPEDLVQLAGRYVLIASLSGIWGVLIGLIFASSAVAIIFHMVEQTMLEEAVVMFFPKVGRWLPGGLLYSLAGDADVPGMLGFRTGLVVYVGWLALLAAAALLVARARRNK